MQQTLKLTLSLRKPVKKQTQLFPMQRQKRPLRKQAQKRKSES